MESFLKEFSTIPNKFIKDFFIIAHEDYQDSELVIDFDIVVVWLNVRKDNLKKTLVDNFDENYDFIIKSKIKTKKNGGTTYHHILITPNCFKELCMLSQTPKAKEVRRYFIEMERLIRKYNQTIKENLYKKIGVLETNQKPKINIRGGVMYVLEALNNSSDSKTLYKLGKTTNIRNRLATYNSGNANEIVPIFVIEVDDIDSVEKCVKLACKKFQYRKYKEVYEIDIDVLKEAISKCDSLITGMSRAYNKQKSNKNTKDFNNKIKRIRNRESKYYAVFSPNE